MECPDCRAPALAVRIVGLQKYRCCLACNYAGAQTEASFDLPHDVAFA